MITQLQDNQVFTDFGGEADEENKLKFNNNLMKFDNDSDSDDYKNDLKTSRRLITPDDFPTLQQSETTLDSLESS